MDWTVALLFNTVSAHDGLQVLNFPVGGSAVIEILTTLGTDKI